MTSEKTNIYILQLKHGKYYIGKSDDLHKRYHEHLEGRGSAWTRKHVPIKLIQVISDASPFDEDKYTKEYMAKYGVDNVRGGSYVSCVLDEVQQETLQTEIWAATDCCTTCGRKGHFASKCYAKTDILGNEIVYESSDDESDDSDNERFSEDIVCFRCGRDGHYSSGCYASYDVDGRKLIR